MPDLTKVGEALNARSPVSWIGAYRFDPPNLEQALLPAIETDWIVLTGSLCSGKSTLIRGLGERGIRTSAEAARDIIDAALDAGASEDEIFSSGNLLQNTIIAESLRRQIIEEPSKQVVFDKSVVDGFVYGDLYDVPLEPLRHLTNLYRYKAVLFCESVPLVNERARPETLEQQRAVEAAMRAAYAGLGYNLIDVPAFPEERLGERLELVIQILRNL